MSAEAIVENLEGALGGTLKLTQSEGNVVESPGSGDKIKAVPEQTRIREDEELPRHVVTMGFLL